MSSQKAPRGRKSPNQQQKHQQHDSSNTSPKQPSQTQTPNQSNTPKQPGMFQRVAETAAGVAVGSAIGNVFTSAVSGLFGSGSSSDPKSSSDKSENACEKDKLNFIRCTENENDLAKCEELQKEYKECRIKYNLP